MGKITLYIDVDGVVRNLKAKFKESEFYKGKDPSTYRDPDFTAWWRDCMKNVHKCRSAYTTAPVYEGAKEKIQELRNSGKFKGVKFLTANAFNDVAKDSTTEFLKRNGLIDSEQDVVFVKSGKEKPGWLKENPGILIDDKLETIMNLEPPAVGIWIRSGLTDETKTFDDWKPKGPKLMFETLADIEI